MKISTTSPGQPGWAPAGSFFPLEEVKRGPESRVWVLGERMCTGALLAAAFFLAMKGKKNIGSKFF